MSGPPRPRLLGQALAARPNRADRTDRPWAARFPSPVEEAEDVVPLPAGEVASSYPGLVAEVCADLDGSAAADHPTVRVYPRLLEPAPAGLAAADERVRPLYARVLRLRHVDPGGLLCFVFFEGTVILGLLLALAELVNWWGVLILPLTVAVMVKVNDAVAAAVVRSAARVPDLEQERFRREMLPAIGRARVPERCRISPNPTGAAGVAGSAAPVVPGRPPAPESAGVGSAGVGSADRSRPKPGTPVEAGAAGPTEALPAAARLVLGRAAASRIRANAGQAGAPRAPTGRPVNAYPVERMEQWPAQQSGLPTDQPDTPQQRARQSGSLRYE
jgi:hypothetical protein